MAAEGLQTEGKCCPDDYGGWCALAARQLQRGARGVLADNKVGVNRWAIKSASSEIAERSRSLETTDAWVTSMKASVVKPPCVCLGES